MCVIHKLKFSGALYISIAEIKNNKLDVKSVCGDAHLGLLLCHFMTCKLYHLGGQDFDERIMKYVIEEFKKSNNYDMLRRPKLIKRLRRACKEAKESLSFKIESWNVKVRNVNFINSEMELIFCSWILMIQT